MVDLFVQAFAISCVSWFLWIALRRFFVKGALDNIPGPPPTSFWQGCFDQVYNLDGWAYHEKIAAKYGSLIKVKAPFGATQLFVFDPKALYSIFNKDQDIFEETSAFLSINKVSYGEGLLSTVGEQHRKQRKMLNPVFSIAHMRNMVPIFYGVSYKLRDAIGARVKDGPREIEVVSWMTRTALELVGQSGLGYSFDSLTEDAVPHPYTLAAKNFVPSLFRLRLSVAYLLPIFSKIGPAKFRRFIVDILPWKNLRVLRDVIDVMEKTSVEIFESKKKALAQGDEALASQIGQGKDIMSILMRANLTAAKAESLTEEELLGQMSVLIFAAMDTTSTALTRILHLLATHPDVQDKLRKEITEAKEQYGHRDLSYDEIFSLPYLDAICRETLRLHPPVTMVERTTRQDVVLPLSTPIIGLDGQEIRQVPIPKNTTVIIGILEANRNAEIWGPDADEWKPERWMTSLPDTVVGARLPGVYSHLLTFIGGSRACIGFKFAQLEMKVVLSLLIESFRFKPSHSDIIWQMTAITTSVVKGSDSNIPSLSLLVERVI